MTVTLTKHLPRRPQPLADTCGLPATEVAACRAAAYTNALWNAFQMLPPVLVMDWRGHPSGIAVAPLQDGGRLVHIPGGERTSLLAQLPCTGGAVHETAIHWPTDLDTARRAAAHCREHSWSPEPVNEVTEGLQAAVDQALNRMRAAKGGQAR